MKKAVLLDVDGTLLDTWDFIFDAVKHAVSFHGFQYPSEDNIKKATGKPLIEFYQFLFPKADPEILAKTHADFQSRILIIGKTYPKTIETLKKLKQKAYLIAAISNRSRKSLLASLKTAKITDFFDLILSAEDVKNPKPHKEPLLTALKVLKVLPKNACMVGDLEADIIAGKTAKVKTVGVTYGFLGKDIAKHNPDYLIDDIEELVGILK